MRQNQEAAVRSGILKRDRHQRLHQLRQLDFAGHRLRSLDHRRGVQLLDGRAACRRGKIIFTRGQLRIAVG